MIKSSALLMVSTMIKIPHGYGRRIPSNSCELHARQCTPYTATGSQDGLMGVAATGDKALAGNRVTAGKAAIITRHIAVLAALQIDLAVLAEWGPSSFYIAWR